MGTKFRSEMTIRPSDIDFLGHVHNSIYLDYILHARMDQMTRCYKYPMEKFFEQGLGWVAKTAHLNYLRPVKLNDRVFVDTYVESFEAGDCRVNIEIRIQKGKTEKVALDGYMIYTLVSMKTGRSVPLPADVIEAYSI
jgi:acyl-CoA thioester hydrolase/thioesterase-3